MICLHVLIAGSACKLEGERPPLVGEILEVDAKAKLNDIAFNLFGQDVLTRDLDEQQSLRRCQEGLRYSQNLE